MILLPFLDDFNTWLGQMPGGQMSYHLLKAVLRRVGMSKRMSSASQISVLSASCRYRTLFNIHVTNSTIFYRYADQLNMALCCWYLVKSDFFRMHEFRSVDWTSHFFQGTKCGRDEKSLKVFGKKIKILKNGGGAKYQVVGNYIHPCFRQCM